MAAKGDSSRVAFRIPSQPLDEALLALAQQAGLQLAAVGDLDRAVRSAEVSGVMTVETALRRLLAGSGYGFELRPQGVVTISAARPSVTPPIATPVSSETMTNLATVVVSARRRDERWIDVPIAVAVAEASDMEKLGVTNATEALHLMPGVTAVDTGNAFTQVQIRGISSSLAGNDNGYYLDDAPFSGVTVPWHPDTRAFDLDRIEVLKGPQGTLFGEGSMGGTVRIFTHAPDLDRFGVTAALGATATEEGGYGASGKAMLNTPVVPEHLALRFVTTRENLPGWVDVPEGKRDINEQHIQTHRIRARWSASDRWMTDVGFMDSTTQAAGGGYGADDRLESPALLGTRVQLQSATLATHYDLSNTRVSLFHSDMRMTDRIVGHLNPNSSVDGTIRIDSDNTELRWASITAGRWDWLLGYAHRRSRRFDDLQLDGVLNTATQFNRADAVFGEATFRPRAQWAVTAGLRYFMENVLAEGNSEQVGTRLDATFHRVIPRLSVSRHVSSHRLLYASLSTGFRSGQIQSAQSLLRAQQLGIQVPLALSPDTLVTYELGVKQVLIEGRLRMQSAVFHNRWRGLPVRVPIDETVNALTNSSGATVHGAEVDFRYTPRTSVDIGVSATFSDARYVADVPGTPLRRGSRVYNVAPVSLAGSVSYAWRVNNLTASVAAGARYHSRRKTGLVGTNGGDPITAVNLRLGVESPQGWGWYLQGDNLTNEHGAVDGRDTVGQATRLHPRSVGIEFQYRY